MLVDRHGAVAVSSLGWVDRSSLWIFEASCGSARSMPLGDAKFLSLHPGTDGFFSLRHDHEGAWLEVTVHAFVDPAAVVARAVVHPEGSRLEGDIAAWRHVSRSYAAWYAAQGACPCPSKRRVC